MTYRHRLLICHEDAGVPKRLRSPAVSVSRLVYTLLMAHRSELSELSFIDSLRSDARRDFYEGHKPIAIAMILIVLLLPFAGLSIMGLLGVALAVIVSVLAYCLTPYIWLKLCG